MKGPALGAIILLSCLVAGGSVFFAVRQSGSQRLRVVLLDAAAKRAALEDEIRTKESELAASRVALADLQGRAEASEAALTEARAGRKAAEAALRARANSAPVEIANNAGLEAALLDASTKRAALEDTIRTRESELAASKVALAELQGRAESSERAATRIASLEKDLADARTGGVALRNRLTEAEVANILLRPPPVGALSVDPPGGAKQPPPFVFSGKAHPEAVAVLVNGHAALLDSAGAFQATVASSTIVVEEIDAQGRVIYYSEARTGGGPTAPP